MILLVLVAHDGKTLQLDVSGQTRVDAVQQALVSVTGIGVSDQIVMCHGARLDPAKPLAAYKLPLADVSAAEDTPVFLYHKLYLRPGAAPPPQEPLPVFEVTVPGLPAVGLRHPLHSAHSPLIRALPDYEAQFSQQLGEARAHWEASEQRLAKCRQLMSEQEVQARAADAARANVESHYNYIASIYAAFVDKYVSQHQAHSALLTQFGALSSALGSVALPPQLQREGQWRVLADLQPRVKLAEWHESCSRSHTHFEQKVVELEGVFQLLRGDVERLFLQAPCVDLDALGQQLAEAEGRVEEQASIVQVLSKDLATVQGLVESVVSQLGSSAGGASLSGAALHDSCAAVDTLLEQHLSSLLPRVRACDGAVAEFLLRCGEAKASMTRDVLEQLQGIAAQQSRIRDMKHKLALLNEVLARQAAAFAELQAANRLPAAYRLALAECARRGAWRELYAEQAARLAEHCGRITAKEGAKREAVNRQLERHLPHDLLAAAGLLAEPPHCMVSLPPSDTVLLRVTPADIAKLPAAIQAAADAAAAEQRPPGDASAAGSSSVMVRAARRSSTDGSSSTHPAAARSATPTAAAGALTPRAVAPSMLASGVGWRTAAAAADPAAASTMLGAAGGGHGVAAAGGGGGVDLAVENARLRAELAGLLAQQAAKELGEDLASTAAAGAAAAGASQLLGASVTTAAGAAASSMALAASTAAAATAGQQQQQRPYGHGGSPVVPASVTAALPSVSAALAGAQQVQEGAAAAAATQRALTLGPVKAALAAKDELVGVLESRVNSLTTELASYEGRITALEAQLTAAAAAGTRSAAAAVGATAAVEGAGSGHSSSSSRVQQTAAEPKAPQQQEQQQQVGSPPPGQQSAAPAFLLDATQAPSFFTPAAATADAATAAAGADATTAAAAAAVVLLAAGIHQQQQQQGGQAQAGQDQQQEAASVGAAAKVVKGSSSGSSSSSSAGSGVVPPSVAQDSAADTTTVDAADASTHQQQLQQQQQGKGFTQEGAGCSGGVTADPAVEAPQQQHSSSDPPAAAADTAAPVDDVLVQQPHGSSSDSTPAAAAAAAPLSVSEPDLRGVLVAGPADVAAAHQQEGQGRRHRASLDSSTAAAAAAAAATGVVGGAAAGAGGGLTGLLSSSMHYLFHRTSSSARGDSGSGSSNSSTAAGRTPLSSPPPGATPAAAAASVAGATGSSTGSPPPPAV